MDVKDLMEQAKNLQGRIAAAQDKLDKVCVQGVAENGACIINMTGKYDLIDLTIRRDILPLGAERVSKIIATAYRDAKAKIDKIIDEVMGEATAGIPLPK